MKPFSENKTPVVIKPELSFNITIQGPQKKTKERKINNNIYIDMYK